MVSRYALSLCVFFFSFFVLTFPARSVTFSPEDLAGTWYAHQVVTGDAPGDEPRWGYGTVTIDTSGNYSTNWTNPGHANEVSTGAIQINIDGLFSVNNKPLTHGAMNDAKNLLVFIDGSQESEGHALVVLVKRAAGSSFGSSDLAGTWYGHQIVSGDAPADIPRWGYGTVTIDNSGNYSANWTSPGSPNEVIAGAIQINAQGIFTVNGQSLTHGVMNDARDMLVFIDGTSESEGNGLFVLVKRSAASFSSSDFAGDWYGYHVVSGDAPGDDPRWGYGTATINSTGDFTADWSSPTSANELSNGSLSVGPNGLFTINNQLLTHGAISDAEDLFVFVDGTAESQGNALSIFIKRSPAVNTGSNMLLLNTLK